MRTLMRDIASKENETVTISGRVLNIRALGEITFILVQDYTGSAQTVWETGAKAKTGEVVSVTGRIRKDERAKSGYEIAGEKLEIVAENAEELPIDLSKKDLNLQLATLLDHRTLTLRHPKIQAIFKLYAALLKSYAEAMREEGFTEIKTPKILEAASEGGGNFFKIQYFDREAFLAQSPQFYKQIMVGVFERVFEIGPVFRAEPHFTTRHVNEYISLDAEMGFIQDEKDVMRMLNLILKNMFADLEKRGKNYLEIHDAALPKVPDEIPTIKLNEIKKTIAQKYGYKVSEDTDIDPEGERLAGRYAKEELNSDFIFLTRYPREHRPFYAMPAPENPKETNSFDLLFKGLEIATGGQRIHIYDDLIASMKLKNVKPNGMEFYLNTFKYALPPHGGWGMGVERIVQKILNLESVKEAVLFPRDVKRLNP